MSRLMHRAATLLVAALLLMVAPTARAAVTIKLATLAPEGSTWHRALANMAEDWVRITDGEVQVKIYAGGVAGNETVMLRKMRIGQLHAAAMTNLGLLDIDPSAQVINTPMLIRDYDELDYVMVNMAPEFERRVEENGFQILAWSDAGWAHLFTKDPITDPDDIGKLKMFAWEGDPAAVEMFRKGGFRPVVVASTDVLPSLQSGLIDSFPSTPLGALALQWFALAPNMLDVPWAPLMGVTVISQQAWDAIPEQYHAELMAASRASGEELKAEIRRQDQKAVEVMQKYGLQVHQVDEATEARWVQMAHSVHPIVREKIVPPEIFDQTVELLEAYRAANP